MTDALLIVAAGLFGLGMFGFLTRRNLILMFLSLELMLSGVSLNFIVWGNRHGDLGGQVFVLLILTVAACEAALALAVVVALHRRHHTLDVNIWQSLRETRTSSYDRGDLLAAATDQAMTSDSYGPLPKLTPAGRDPLQYPQPSGPREAEHPTTGAEWREPIPPA